MTSTPVKWVLDELGAVVDAQPAEHPLRRVDRDNALVFEGGGMFDMSASIRDRTGELQHANFVGATYADRNDEYEGTKPDLDLQEIVGIRVEGYSGSYGHVDPLGEDGVVFSGTDDSLVQQIIDALYDGLQFPDAGRTPVEFTHLSLTNHAPQSDTWAEYHRYDFDVVFDGFEELS